MPSPTLVTDDHPPLATEALPHPESLATIQQAKDWLNVSHTKIYQLFELGILDPPIKLGPGRNGGSRLPWGNVYAVPEKLRNFDWNEVEK